jgi:hypothetical protein
MSLTQETSRATPLRRNRPIKVLKKPSGSPNASSRYPAKVVRAHSNRDSQNDYVEGVTTQLGMVFR